MLIAWHNARRQHLKVCPQEVTGLKKDSNYHSVETYPIFVKVRTSERTPPTSLALLLTCLLQTPQRGFLVSLWISKPTPACLCPCYTVLNMFLKHHLNLPKWSSSILVPDNMVLKPGENQLKNKTGKELTKRQHTFLLE